MQEVSYHPAIQKLERYILDSGINLNLDQVTQILAELWPDEKLVLFTHQMTGIKVIGCEKASKNIASKMFQWTQDHKFDLFTEKVFELDSAGAEQLIQINPAIVSKSRNIDYHCKFWRISNHQKASVILALAQQLNDNQETIKSGGLKSRALKTGTPKTAAAHNRDFAQWVQTDEAQHLNHLLKTCLAIDFSDDRRLVQQFFQFSTIPTMLLTIKGRALYANAEFANLTGYTTKQLTNTPLGQTLMHGLQKHPSVAELNSAIKLGQSWTGEFDINTQVTGVIQITLNAAPVINSQGKKRVLVQVFDMTSYKEERELLHQLAYYDATTGLPNRLTLRERLSVANANARTAGHIGALLLIDLDHFTSIVDVYGHHHGDSVVKHIAQKIERLVNENVSLYRLGGDEIGVLIPRLSSKHRDAQILSMEMSEAIRKMIEQPFVINDIQHFVTVSIGAVTFPKALEGTEDLLREADTALHGAKSSGRNCSMLFHTAMYQAIRLKCEVEAGVRQALMSNQFLIYIQPQVNQKAQWCSAEILIRWLHPEKGIVTPNEFIPVAEDTGQIIQIGHWVLNQSFAFLAELTDAGKPIPISINISAHQIKESNFVQQILDLIDYYQVEPEYITLEITESLLLSDLQKSTLVMQELSQVGISFSIDDFGTGYSNLNYLSKLPVKELKIDRSFIMQVTDNKQDAILVKSLISLGHQLSLEVVAEGVETRAQAKFLVSLACEKMQGYFYSKPITLAQFRAEWLDD
jgi:diguanylate cyclase (GGDEF)-like protein/PAS domain S-box-containing protein